MSRLQNIMGTTLVSIEKFSQWTGRMVSWLTLFLVLLVFTVVVLRYLFSMGSIPMQESIVYLHGMIFLLGSAYTLQQNEHVRVDVFYTSMSPRKKAWVDMIGSIVLLFPVCLYIFSMSLDYVLISWRINESSGEAGGLPGLYWLKSLILVMPVLMMLQGAAWILRCYLYLFANAKSPYSSTLANNAQAVK